MFVGCQVGFANIFWKSSISSGVFTFQAGIANNVVS